MSHPADFDRGEQLDHPADAFDRAAVRWLSLVLLALSAAPLLHLALAFYPNGDYETGASLTAPASWTLPRAPRPPSTARTIGWLGAAALVLGSVVIWGGVAAWGRGPWRWAALGAALWYAVAAGVVFFHYSVLPGTEPGNHPPWWFWAAWRATVWGTWMGGAAILIRSRLQARRRRKGAGSNRPRVVK